MVKSKLTVEEVNRIVDLRKKGYSYKEIGKELNYSAAYCCDIYRAYNLHEPTRNKMVKYVNVLETIDKALAESQNEIKEPLIYECKILFGLFTLKFNPKY